MESVDVGEIDSHFFLSPPADIRTIAHDGRLDLQNEKKNAIDTYIGNKISELRTRRRVKLTDLAAVVGIDPDTLRDFEEGSERVPADILIRLSRVLRFEITELFGGIPSNLSANSPPAPSNLPGDPEIAALLGDFRQIRDPQTRTLIRSLVRAYLTREKAGEPD